MLQLATPAITIETPVMREQRSHSNSNSSATGTAQSGSYKTPDHGRAPAALAHGSEDVTDATAISHFESATRSNSRSQSPVDKPDWLINMHKSRVRNMTARFRFANFSSLG